jgi:simple sugar transport system ATP-binding protein
MPVPRLELQHVSKEYPGVRANDDVSLTIAPGEIHAVLGENGAGKSTLMKIIYGVLQPDSGRILWEGAPVRMTSPEHARRLGISMVFQHFSLFESLTVAENIWLGLASESLAEVVERLRRLEQSYGLSVEPMQPVHTLSAGERQRVEVLRALLTEPKLLILDEPTSVLTPQATAELFATLRRLQDSGCSILYISHKLEEVRSLCQRCTVLRDGKVSGEVDEPATRSVASLSRLMIGNEPPPIERRPPEYGATVLRVEGLDVPKRDDFGVSLRGVTFSLRAGEILGVAGVTGNGQKELLAVLSGEDLSATGGRIELFGNDVMRLGPSRRRALGLRYVPEERLGVATVPSQSLSENMLLTRRAGRRSPWVPWRALDTLTSALLRRFDVKASGPHASAASLSGGNLQKYVIGREIEAKPKVLLVAQPTWGVDVGAAASIKRELVALRDTGAALLIVSEDLDELFELSDTLCVMANGALSPALSASQATRSRIGEWMSGLWLDRAEPLTAASERNAVAEPHAEN